MIFPRFSHEIMTLLDKLVQFLGDAGPKVNAEKTVLITTQAQTPPYLTTSTGIVMKVTEEEASYKSWGCMLSAAGSKKAFLDTDCHLQSASRAFFANKWISWAEMCPSEESDNSSVQLWHQSRVFDLGPDVSTMLTWSNLISTLDAWSKARLGLQAGSAVGIRGTKFCISGISAQHVAWKHGQKLALLNTRNLLAISWISLMNVGHPECYIGSLLEEDLWDVQHWIGRLNVNNFLDWGIERWEGGRCRCWPMDDWDGRLRQILYTV